MLQVLAGRAHPQCTRTSKLFLQTTLERPRCTRPVRICRVDSKAESTNTAQEEGPHGHAHLSSHDIVLFQREHAHDIFIFVDWFTEIPSLLLVGPVAVGVSILSLDSWRVDIATVLHIVSNIPPLEVSPAVPCSGLLLPTALVRTVSWRMELSRLVVGRT